MREAECRSIDGREYEIRPLNTSAMLKLMGRLVRLVGPSVGSLDSPAQLADAAQVGRLLAELAERIDDAEVLAVCMTLAESTQVLDGDKKLPLAGKQGAQWELHFQGDPVGLLKWLGTALEVNLGPLAAWLGTLTAQPAAGAPATAPRR